MLIACSVEAETTTCAGGNDDVVFGEGGDDTLDGGAGVDSCDNSSDTNLGVDCERTPN